MRRSDREVTDFGEMVEIMQKCDVCRIALNGDGYPYILPLNFGMKVEEGSVVLYFHGAGQGMKHDLLRADDRASFEMDCGHRLVTDDGKGTCTMEYESVIGQGHVEVAAEEEKEEALRILMCHYHREDFAFDKSVIPATTVLKLTVERMTGKRRRKQA